MHLSSHEVTDLSSVLSAKPLLWTLRSGSHGTLVSCLTNDLIYVTKKKTFRRRNDKEEGRHDLSESPAVAFFTHNEWQIRSLFHNTILSLPTSSHNYFLFAVSANFFSFNSWDHKVCKHFVTFSFVGDMYEESRLRNGTTRLRANGHAPSDGLPTPPSSDSEVLASDPTKLRYLQDGDFYEQIRDGDDYDHSHIENYRMPSMKEMWEIYKAWRGKIVWRNVLLMTILHTSFFPGLFYFFFTIQWKTFFYSEYYSDIHFTGYLS